MSQLTRRVAVLFTASIVFAIVLAIPGFASIDADPGGPYSIAEGDAVTLDGTQCTSSATIVSYGWNLDADPAAEASGVTPLLTWTQLVSFGIDDDGGYTVELTVQNSVPETDTDSATLTVTNSPPVVDAGHTYDIFEGDTLNLDGSGTFDFGDDVLGPYDWDLDGDKDYSDGVTGATPAVSWAQLEGLSVNDDGEYTIWLRVADEDGAVAEASARLTIHNTPPVAQVTGGPYAIAEGEDLSVTGTASDISSADTFSYVWDIDGEPISDPDFDDGVAVANKVVPWEELVDLGMGDGPSVHTVRLTVMDDDGSISSDSTPFTISNTAPVITVCPEDLTTYYDDPVEGLEGEFFDPGTDTWTGTVDWKDGTVEPITIDSANQEYELPSHTYLTAPPGETDYDVEIEITDDDGGVGSCVFTITVIHDVTPPTVWFTDTPDDPSNDMTPHFAWMGSDDFTPTDEIVYSWRLDDGAWSDWSTATEVTLSLPSPNNVHAFEVRAKDLADNVSDPILFEWEVDATPPAVFIETPSLNQKLILNSVVLADWWVQDLGTGIDTVVASFPDGAPIDTSMIWKYIFTVQATDYAGNLTEKSVRYRVAPAVVPVLPPDQDQEPGEDNGMLPQPSFGEIWSFLTRPLPTHLDADGNLVIDPVPYVLGETIGVRFRLADALGVPVINDTGNVFIDIVRVIRTAGQITEYDLIDFYEVPYDPDLELYATEIPFGEEEGWRALTPGLYKLSLTIRAVWLESLEIETIWIEFLPAND